MTAGPHRVPAGLLVVSGALLGWLLAVAGGRSLAGHGAGWLVAAVLVVLTGTVVLARLGRVGPGLLAGLGAWLAVLPYERALGGTAFAWGGLGGDQSFRTEYLTRFAASPAVADYTYARLPAFYPPAWFWLVGRAAALTGTPAWQVLRPATTLTVVVMVSVAALVAAPAVGRRTAALCAAVAAAFGSGTLWEPYSLLAGFLVLALLLRLPGLLAGRWRATGGLAVGFAAVFLCYTYGAAVLGLTAVTVAVLGRPRGARLLQVVGAGAAALLVTAWYWLPSALAPRPPGLPAQVSWLSAENTSLPWSALSPAHPAGVVALTGLVWVLVRGGRTAEAQAVRVFLVVAAGWCLLSFLLSRAAGLQLQPNRVGDLAALVCCGCVGLAVRDALRSWAQDGWRPTRAGVVVVAVVVLAAGTWAAVGWAAERSEPGAVQARSQRAPAQAARVASMLHDVLGRPVDELVVVSDRRDVLATTALRGFQQWNQTYASPAADFPARERYLRAVFASRTAGEVSRRLRHTPWGRIDALVLTRSGGSYLYGFVRQDAAGHDEHVRLRLPGRLVSGPTLRELPAGGSLVVVVPR